VGAWVFSLGGGKVPGNFTKLPPPPLSQGKCYIFTQILTSITFKQSREKVKNKGAQGTQVFLFETMKFAGKISF